MFVLATFNNRTHALQFSNQLKSKGVSVKIINMPREISSSCGLSVMFNYQHLNHARVVVGSNKFSSFRGFYLKKHNGNTFLYEKIN